MMANSLEGGALTETIEAVQHTLKLTVMERTGGKHD